ncbi:MAG: MASE1 domain-containing protein [Phaeospirillum sp.]|nr:MASE1 domain-containing protein [Phaeospirillum sp.]
MREDILRKLISVKLAALELTTPQMAVVALYPLAWVLSHKAAVAMNVGPGVSVWYPPAGLTFAFLLSFPRLWPLAYVGIGYVVLLGPYATTNPGAVLSWLIPPTGYVLGITLLRRAVGTLDLSKQAHIHRFIIASLATPSAVAAINVLNFCADGAIPWSDYGSMVARFFIGDALGIVTLTPALLLLNRPWRTYIRNRSFGVLALGLLAAALILYLEVAELLLGHDQGRFSYFVMLPVAWNAVAFGVLGAALSTLLANASITLASLLDPNQEVLAGAPYFMLSIGYLSLIIAGAVEDREGALRRLRRQETALDKAYRHFTTQETAAKLAHEINQPLSCVLAYAQGLHALAQRGGGDPGELPQVTERIVREVERVSGIITANQSRLDQQAGSRELLSFRLVLTDVLPLLQQMCDDNGVATTMDVAGCSANVLGDRATLQQLAVNLVRNACEAMATMPVVGKRLRVEAKEEDGKVILCIRDSGPGFPDDIIQAGHALFASTKQTGSGFGLPIAKAILTAHGGDLEIANDDRGGASVTCWLPKALEDDHGR